MAFNIATVCLKNDPTTTPEDVIKLKLSLDANRLLVHEGMTISKLTVFTDYAKADFMKAQPTWNNTFQHGDESMDPNVESGICLLYTSPSPRDS